MFSNRFNELVNNSDKEDIISHHLNKDVTSLGLLVIGRNKIASHIEIEKIAIEKNRDASHTEIGKAILERKWRC